MALKLGTLQIDIEANTADFKKAEKEIERGTTGISKGLKRAGAALAAFFSVQAIARVTMLADELRVAERRIEILSDSTFEANRNLQSLKNTANETGQEFKAVFSIFENFKRIQDDIGATDDQVLQFTDSLSKLGLIGGSSGEELNNALRQLSQGLAGGIVRAEEFNSIVENTPEIAQAIARGLGKSLGELRGMVLEGELLADDVFGSILDQTDAINERFEETPKSLKQLFQETQNLLTDLVGNIDKLTGATEFFAQLWEAANDRLKDVVLSTKQLADLTLEEAKIRRQAAIDEITAQNEIIAKARETLETLQEQGIAGQQILIAQAKIAQAEQEKQKAVEEGVKLDELVLKLKEDQNVAIEEANELLDEQNIKAEELKETYESFDIGKFIEFEQLKSAMQEANAEFERTTELAESLSEFDDAFAGMEEDAKNFDAILKEVNDETIANALEAGQELADTWGNTFGVLEGLAKNHHDKLFDDQIEAVQKREDLTEEEKDHAIKILEEEKAKASGIEKAAFRAKQLANIASIVMDTARNVIAAGGLTPMGIAQGVFGAAQVAAVAAQPAPGRQEGGNVGTNALTPINENGDPEVLTSGAKQFLLTGNKGGRITSGRNMAMNDAGGGMRVVINNLAPGTEVVQESVTKEEVVLLVRAAENNAVKRVNNSIRQNQGSTARAMSSTRSRSR